MTTSSARVSIVIPAHDEQHVIGTCLEALLADAAVGEFEVVVVPNGCSDGTARVAAGFPSVTVVEVAEASKIAALNAGDRAASVFPRIYLDADVVLSTAAARALGDLLRSPGGPLIAAPVMHVDTRASSRAVRMQHQVWELSDFRGRGHVGSGVYALSAEGRARFGEFPDVIADDRYVQQLFSMDERGVAAGHRFTIRAPRTLPAALRRSRRAAAGNAQLVALGLQGDHAATHGSQGALVGRVLRRPALWPAFAVYTYAHYIPRVAGAIALRQGAIRWDRDETSRS